MLRWVSKIYWNSTNSSIISIIFWLRSMIEMFPVPNFWGMQVVENFLFFEIYVLIFVLIGLFLFLRTHTHKNILFAVIAVWLYKYLTLSLFGNSTCMCSGNTYPDVGSINIFIGALDIGVLLIAKYLSEWCKYFAKYRFVSFLTITYLIFLLNEVVIQTMWIRVYSNDISSLLSQSSFFMLPIESIPYIFAAAFYQVGIYGFLEKVDQTKEVIASKRSFAKIFCVSLMAVFALQIIVHPIFLDTWLPTFTYIYQDINWLMTIIWSLCITSIFVLIGKQRLSIYNNLVYSFAGVLLFNLILFIILFHEGILRFSPNVADYLWWINLMWLPIEAMIWLTLATLMQVLCIKRF